MTDRTAQARDTGRIRRAVSQHAAICNLDPEDFDQGDLKAVASAAGVKLGAVKAFMAFWYGDED